MAAVYLLQMKPVTTWGLLALFMSVSVSYLVYFFQGCYLVIIKGQVTACKQAYGVLTHLKLSCITPLALLCIISVGLLMFCVVNNI